MHDVTLVLPPLINTSFGNCYASTAVLAGHLRAHTSFSVRQYDLNDAMVTYLLEGNFLREFGQGYYRGTVICEVADMAAVSARLIDTNRELLFDEQGRYAYNFELTGPGHLLLTLTEPMILDLSVPDMIDVFDSDRFPFNLYRDFSRWATEGKEWSASLIGISIPMAAQLMPALYVARQIRQMAPSATIVLGGPTISLMMDSDMHLLLTAFPWVDVAVRFDGEHPLTALAEWACNGHGSLADAPGCVFLDDAGKLVKTAPAHGPKASELAPAYYEPEQIRMHVQPELDVTVSRGCYWGECSYCDFVELYGLNESFRNRTAHAVVEEIEGLAREHGVLRFGLITEAISPGFSRRFSELLIERKTGIRWGSFAMVDPRFADEDFELMKRSGCDHLVIGVESMVDSALKLVRKASNREQNVAFLKSASRAGIKLSVNIIPDLPSTTYAQAMETLPLWEELSEHLSWVTIFPFEVTRSSAVGRNPSAFGLHVQSVASMNGQAQNRNNHVEIVDPAMSPEERSEVIRLYDAFSLSVNYERPSPGYGPSATEKAPVVPNGRMLDVTSSDARFRFDKTGTDILWDGSEIVFYNLWTRKAARVNEAMSSILERLSGMDRFGLGELQAMGADTGQSIGLVRKLADWGLVRQASW